MPRFATLRIVVFAGALVVMLIVGARVTTVSAGRAARLAAAGDGQQIQERVPYGYATEQEGSGIELSALVSTLESPADRVTIRNKTDQPVVGVRFVAAVERLSAFRFDPRQPVRVFTSELVRTSVPPGGSATVVPHVLTADALQRIADETGDLRLQYFFGVSEVRYGNGFAWTITPNPAATRGSEALGLEQQPQIARELFARDTNVTPTPHGACRDEKGRATSHGGVMAVRGEPGRFGRCQDGRWVERTVR